ncbi:YceI family protein [Pontibacter silvestris]|uniref:YceI family protein n=1 Tax=Pontibacter silvestris TaxID=2305183 RepID=A0ABW4WUU1_9BACT|nr:YceI family protein [Pontibacter silvestris]MCC9138758.1 YceI family protein [Pontibacter silvestris]
MGKRGTGHNFALKLSGFLLLLALFNTSCDTRVKTVEAEVGEAVVKETSPTPSEAFMIDTAKSEITWIASKMTGRHNGLFQVQNGELLVSDGSLTGGNIVIDVASLRADDKNIDAESNKKLTTHLRSADFFDTEKYPTAVFELTDVIPLDTASTKQQLSSKNSYSELHIKNPTHRVTGNLTIKGETKSVSFPAKLTKEDNQLKAKANFNLDRTQWGLVYRSDKSLGDQTIYSEVNIGIDIVAKASSI